jgi:FAD/FMN-containing dehydrogenase
MQLGGWGRFPRASCAVATPDTPDAVAATLAALPDSIARGNGRAYGDSALNPDGVISSARLSHLLAFDDATGTLTCEAGVLLGDITDALLPRGWFAPVTPGTRFVTVGGMVASDVHGKNHHGAGSFGDHLDWVDLVLPDGRCVRASRDSEPELFAATCGGMGLTGVIVRAAFRLQRVETSRIRQRTLRAPDLAAALDIFEASAASTYSVAWIDGLARGARLGRSVVHLGEHARLDELAAADRATPFARNGAAAADGADRLSGVCAVLADGQGVQRTGVPPARHRRAAGRPRPVFLPARCGARLEPHLRRARLRAVSVRAAAGRKSGRGCGGCSRRLQRVAARRSSRCSSAWGRRRSAC